MKHLIKLNFGRKFSEQTRLKMSCSNIKSIKVEVTDLETGISINYSSVRQAAKAINGRSSTIYERLKIENYKPYRNRYIIKKK
jgi:hypothetical protein